MADGITVDVANYKQLCKALDKVPKNLAVGLKRFNVRMAKSGINTVVRNEVTRVYNIKKGDVNAESYRHYDQVGAISLSGVSVPFFKVTYESKQMLTPTHFGMTPKARPGNTPPFVFGRKAGRNYKVRWKPFRAGGREVLTADSGMPAFITSANNASLAFARLGAERKPIEVIKRLSVPIMISDGKVAPQIQSEIEKRVEKELARIMR